MDEEYLAWLRQEELDRQRAKREAETSEWTFWIIIAVMFGLV